MMAVSPGKTKIKQAANPPISEITRPISGMKRARTRVTTNHTRVCRILLLCSRRTHTSTCSPWKRSQSPSTTALERHVITPERSEGLFHKLHHWIRRLVYITHTQGMHQTLAFFFSPIQILKTKLNVLAETNPRPLLFTPLLNYESVYLNECNWPESFLYSLWEVTWGWKYTYFLNCREDHPLDFFSGSCKFPFFLLHQSIIKWMTYLMCIGLIQPILKTSISSLSMLMMI